MTKTNKGSVPISAHFQLLFPWEESGTESELKLLTIIVLVIITVLIYILISLLTKTFKYSDIKLKY